MKLSWFGRLEEWLIAFLLAAMTLITFMQVVARYVFNYSFVWALEATIFLFGALIFLGMSYGVRVHAHIGVDAIVKLLPNRGARIITIIATLLCIAYSIIVLIGSWVYVEKMYMIGILAQDIPIPQWIPRVVVPVGAVLLLLRFLQILIDLLRGRRTQLLGDEVEDAMKLHSDTQPIDEQAKP